MLLAPACRAPSESRTDAKASASAGGLAKASASAEGPPLDPAEPGIVARFGRTACYGACPTYNVALREDGQVLYEGIEYTVTAGKAEKRVGPDIVEKVRAAFERADFFHAAAPSGLTVSGSQRGTSEAFLYYAKGGKARRIDLPEGCDATPVGQALVELRSELDTLLETEKWVGTPEERKRFGSGHAH